MKVGVLYHPRRDDARASAEEAGALLTRLGVAHDLLPAWNDGAIVAAAPTWQMCITCGGDGTILRTSRIVSAFGVPQLGVNLGRLGFLAEMEPDEMAERLPQYMEGHYSIEERAMLRARVNPPAEPAQVPAHTLVPQYDALNEVLVARGSLPRIVRVSVEIDGASFADVGGDGVLVATATGSTAYSLAAGGPVLAPTLRCMLLNTVCPHAAKLSPLVLPPEAVVRLEVMAGFPAVLSVDGQIDLTLGSGDAVEVALSPHVARFVRARPPAHFYEVIGRALR